MKAHIDFETRSRVDLKKSGLHVYSRDASTDAWCMAFAFDNHPVEIWKMGETLPIDLLLHLKDGGQVLAHNANFEYEIWNSVMVKRYGWPPLPIEQLYCTMAAGYAMALPGSLEHVAPALGIDQQKDMQASRVMLQLAKPKTDGSFWSPEEAPEKFETLYNYCKQDVEVERAAYERMMPLSPTERKLWIIDHNINQRGIQIDIPAVTVAIEIVELEKKRLDAEMRKITNNAVATANATAQLKAFLKDSLVDVDKIAKGDVVDLLKTDLPADCKRALEIRQEGAKSSTAKLVSMVARANKDGRIRGIHQFHGANTGRWAGRGVNMQNLPRPTMKFSDIEKVINSLTKFPVKDLTDNIDMFYGQPNTVISNCIRSFITAAKNHYLIAMDFSAIEARVLAWLAGEEKILEVFRTHGKIYEAQAAEIYRVTLEEVDKDMRGIGKVAVLALGFGGGIGAFQSMAKVYGVTVSDARADEIKKSWRNVNTHIVRYWYALEEAAMKAVRNPGKTYSAGAMGREIKYLVKGSFLLCRLPSGRVICYPYPKVETIASKFGEKDTITYMTEVTGRKWSREKLWYGILAENVTQAVARDVMAEAIVRLEENDIPVVMHVHDEAVVEIHNREDMIQKVKSIIEQVPRWANGLPISADGWSGLRYRK